MRDEKERGGVKEGERWEREYNKERGRRERERKIGEV